MVTGQLEFAAGISDLDIPFDISAVRYLGSQFAVSYSEILAYGITSMPEQVLLRQEPSIDQIGVSVTYDDRAVGVVPVENETTHRVHPATDLLFSGQFSLWGEFGLQFPVDHIALGSDASRKVVASHPQALAQAEAYTKAQGLKPQAASSTAEAIEGVIGNPDDLSLSAYGYGRLATAAYGNRGLQVIGNNIADNPMVNVTRFMIIADKNGSEIDPRRLARKGDQIHKLVALVEPKAPGFMGSEDLNRVLGERGLTLLNETSRINATAAQREFEKTGTRDPLAPKHQRVLVEAAGRADAIGAALQGGDVLEVMNIKTLGVFKLGEEKSADEVVDRCDMEEIAIERATRS